MNNLPRRRLTETVALLDRFHRLHRIDPFDGVGRQPLPSRAFDFSSPGPLLPTGPGRPGPHPTGPPTGLLESPLTSGPGPVPPAASSGRAATRRTAPQTADARPANLKPAPRPRPARLTRVSTGLGAGGLGAGQTADALPTEPAGPRGPPERVASHTHTGPIAMGEQRLGEKKRPGQPRAQTHSRIRFIAMAVLCAGEEPKTVRRKARAAARHTGATGAWARRSAIAPGRGGWET